jgi:hypothetical protein
VLTGAIPALRRRLVRRDEQLLEGGRPRHPEPPVPAGGSRPLPDIVLPTQETTSRAARPRRRRLEARARLRHDDLDDDEDDKRYVGVHSIATLLFLSLNFDESASPSSPRSHLPIAPTDRIYRSHLPIAPNDRT